MNRKMVIAILVFAALLAANFAAGAAQLKLGTLAPEGSPWHEIMLDMVEGWQRVSDGTVRTRVFPGGVAGDEADMVRKMRIGQLHAAALTGEGLSQIAPEIRALQMPMMFASDAELDYVRARIAGRLEAILEAKGFKVLSWGDAGWVHFFARTPAIRPEDLRPMKIFTWAGDTAVADAYRRAGFHPVPLAATEIHSALQAGLIDALPTTPVAALSFQWFGLARHMSDVKWAPLIGAIVVTMRKWRTIADEVKPKILAVAAREGARLQATIRGFGRQAVAVMRKHGLVVHETPPGALAEWERVARRGHASLIGSYVPADIFSEVERLRDEYRRLHGGR